MDVPSHAQVVEQIDLFLQRHSMAPTRLGRDALGEASFVANVRDGRLPGLSTLAKLSDFMREKDRELELSAMAPGDSSTTRRSHRQSAGRR